MTITRAAQFNAFAVGFYDCLLIGFSEAHCVTLCSSVVVVCHACIILLLSSIVNDHHKQFENYIKVITCPLVFADGAQPVLCFHPLPPSCNHYQRRSAYVCWLVSMDVVLHPRCRS